MSSPKNRTRPAVGGKSPVTALNSVVLPAPLAPSTARRSPAATENDTSSMALRASKVRVTPSRTRASPDASGFVAAVRAVITDRSAVTVAIRSLLLAPLAPAIDRLRAIRHVARAEPHLVELLFAQTQRLGHVR